MKVCIEPILTVAVTVAEALAKNTGNENALSFLRKMDRRSMHPWLSYSEFCDARNITIQL